MTPWSLVVKMVFLIYLQVIHHMQSSLNTQCSDADARAVQATYWANKWAKDHG